MSRSTSGDAIADRRFAYAIEYRDAGEPRLAAELVAQALEQAPAWAEGWLVLGELHEQLGENDSAADAYRRALALDSSDRAGATARLVRLGEFHANALTPAHVAALFDDYAPRFEEALVERLGYRAPALLREAIVSLGPRRFFRMLDLGCGTGLAGAALADLCEAMDGVDLSSAMLKRAKERGVYDVLTRAEIVQHVRTLPSASVELVVAADVLVYIGDLALLFSEAARVLAEGGLFAFTAQSEEAGPFRLGKDLRYAHSQAAIRGWADSAGFAIRTLVEASTRQDGGHPVPGFLAVLEKKAGRD